MAVQTPIIYRGQTAGAVDLRPSGQINQILMQQQKQRQAQEQFEAKMRQKQRENNAKALQEALKYNPKSAIEPYNSYIANKTKEQYIDFAGEMYSGGRTPSQEAIVELARRKNSIDADVNKTKQLETALTELGDLAQSDDEVDEAAFFNYTGNLLKDEQGNVRPLEEVNVEAINEFMGTADAYNWGNVDKKITESIEETITEDIKMRNVGGVSVLEDIKTISKFAELDEDGNLVYDEDGNPKLKITPQTLSEYMKYPRAKIIIDDKVQELEESGVQNPTRLDALRVLKGSPVVQQETDFSRVPQDRQTRSSQSNITADDFDIVEGEGIALRDYNRAKQEGVAGFQSIEMPIPNFVRNIQISDNAIGDVQSLRVNEEGEPEIIVTQNQRGQDRVKTMAIPYSKNNLAKIKNAITSKDKKKVFDDLVEKFDNERKNKAPLEVDDAKLKTVSRDIRGIIADLDNKEITEDEAKQNLTQLLSEYGIEEPVDADGRIISRGFGGSSEITIGDKEFSSKNLANMDDELSKLLYDKAKNSFVKTKVDFDEEDPL